MRFRSTMLLLACLALAAPAAAAAPANINASAATIDRDAHLALQRLYSSQPRAAELGQKAEAVLVFPQIIKGAFVIGAQSGNGVLLRHGAPAGYYNISAASFGLQAGGKSFSYALFFMTHSAIDYLRKSDGWAIGTGPTVVVLKDGFSRSLTSTTLTQDVYAIPFGDRGLMGGLGLEGSKITHYVPR